MGIINSILGGLFEVLFWPFRGLSPWFGMIWVSLLTAVLMLSVYRLTSNQDGIRRVKDRIKAHLFELRLYKDNMAVTLRAQRSLLVWNTRYLALNLKPMLVMIVPLLLVLVQLDAWFGQRSFQPGETVLVKVKLREGAGPIAAGPELAVSPGLALDAPPVRIEDEGEIDWRLKVLEPGDGRLTFTAGAAAFERTVAVARKPLTRIPAVAARPRFPDALIHTGPTLPGETPVASVEVRYPAARLGFFGLRVHWLLAFFVLSIILGFSLKGLFKVEI